MKTIFVVLGTVEYESSGIIGVSTQKAQATKMLKAAKRSKELSRQYDWIVLNEYRVGPKYLGDAYVLKPRPKKSKPAAAVTKPHPIPVAPEFNRAVVLFTPSIPS